MVKIPPEVVIKGFIQPGSVYYFPDEHFTDNTPHYFVVININPAEEIVILLVCASSQIERVKLRRKNLPPQTLIEVNPEQYKPFTSPSIFDCNNIYPHSIEDLVQRLVNKKLIVEHAIMDLSIVNQLRNGVLLSPTIPEIYKIQLRQ